MTGIPQLVDVDAASFDTMPCCGIRCPTHPGRMEKAAWLKANAKFGVRARTLLAPDGKPCGYIEYLPGEFAWRGVDARGYLFIHCVWVQVKAHQRKGWGRLMVEACIADAKRAGMKGVAAMVRDGPWMADRRLFLACGFEPVDTAPPDFQLLARKFQDDAPQPRFLTGWETKAARYGAGLTVIRSPQCPHIAKFATEIADSGEKEYGLRTQVVELRSWKQAQAAPTPYAVFSVILDGRVVADHPISRTRFRGIMKTRVRP